MGNKATKNANLMTGGSHHEVQVTTLFLCRDVDDVADIKSPFVYTTAVVGITVPVNAWEFIINPNTLMQVSDLQDFSSYDEIAADTKEALPCAGMDLIYIRGATLGGTLNFRWHSL